MERTVASWLGLALPEQLSFFINSGLFLFASWSTLYVLLVAGHPPIHDTLHNFRHALAVVPCH